MSVARVAANTVEQKPVYQYQVKTWDRDDGLPANQLLEICQTADGFLWISSYEGLLRFDGIAFKLFSSEFRSITTGSVIKALAVDAEDRLWIGTHGSGLVSYTDGSFTLMNYAEPFTHNINTLYIGDDGLVLAGTNNNGVYVLREGSLLPWAPSKAIGSATINRIIRTGDNTLYISTEGQGLLRITDTGSELITMDDGLPSNAVGEILARGEGGYWLATSNGLCLYMDDAFTLVENSEGLDCEVLERDSGGSLWVGFEGGIGRVDEVRGRLETMQTQDAGIQWAVKDLTLDSEENLWVVTRFGELVRLQDSNFVHISSRNGLRGSTIYTMLENPDGSVLVASNEGYLDNVDGSLIQPVDLDSELTGKRIRNLFRDSRERLWIATYSGLLVVHPDGSKTWYTAPDQLPDNRVRLTFEMSDGSIYVGTRNAGLFHVLENEDGSFRFDSVDPDNLLTNALIMSMSEDDRGRLWIGTSGNGLIIYDPNGENRQFTLEQGFVSDIVFNQFTDAEGATWVACNGGIARFENDTFLPLTMENGLPTNSPYDIVEDTDGYVWIPINTGICRIKKTDVNAALLAGEAVSTLNLYGPEDGVQGTFTATGQSMVDSRGRIWFPTFDGVLRVDIDSMRINRFAPKAHLISLVIDGQVQPLNVPVEAGPGVDRLTFRYTGINLSAPAKVSFQYRLDGRDSRWSDFTSDRSVGFTNLDAGDYTFHLRARNSDGILGEEVTSGRIRVLPHFYETIEFRISLVFAAIALMIAIAQWRVRHLRSKQRTLKKTVSERTQEIREKNKILEATNSKLQHAYEKIEEISLTDSLTGLRNRRFVDQTILSDINHVLRKHETLDACDSPRTIRLGFLLMDLDHFKDVNDSYGHAAGDMVIKEAGRLLKSVCREADVIVRWGGEEFLVISRFVEQSEMPILADRLLKTIADHTFDIGSGIRLKLTCCIGFASFPFCRQSIRSWNWESIVSIADTALYVGKRSGRNMWAGIEHGTKCIQPDSSTKIQSRLSELSRDGYVRILSSDDDERKLKLD